MDEVPKATNRIPWTHLRSALLYRTSVCMGVYDRHGDDRWTMVPGSSYKLGDLLLCDVVRHCGHSDHSFERHLLVGFLDHDSEKFFDQNDPGHLCRNRVGLHANRGSDSSRGNQWRLESLYCDFGVELGVYLYLLDPQLLPRMGRY